MLSDNTHLNPALDLSQPVKSDRISVAYIGAVTPLTETKTNYTRSVTASETTILN